MTERPVNLLIARLAAGEPEAYRELYDLLAPALLRVARAITGRSDEAEDALQDVFVELVRRREKLASVQDLEAYLFAMLRHCAMRRSHRVARERQAMRELTPAVASSHDVDAPEDLTRALAELPLEQREVIALKIDGQLTFAQIGEVLGISQNTAASRYRYAIEKLRKSLE